MVASANDVELLRLTSEGDEAAYDELVARHRPALSAFATELANEEATADDLTDAAFDALRERAGEAELIGAVRPFLLMTAADLSGADFDLTAECRGWDPLDAPSQAVLWHTDIEGDPVETVALVSGVPADEVASVVDAARTAVGVPKGGDAALRARLTAYLLGPTASALAAAHAPAPVAAAPEANETAEVEPTVAEEPAPTATDDEPAAEVDDDATGEVPVVVDEIEAEPEPDAEADSEPAATDDDPVDAEVDGDATGKGPVIVEAVIDEPTVADPPDATDEVEIEVEVEPAAIEDEAEVEVDDDATGEVPVIDEPIIDEVPAYLSDEPADETREVPVVTVAAIADPPPPPMVAPPPPSPEAETPVVAPAEHAAFMRPTSQSAVPAAAEASTEVDSEPSGEPDRELEDVPYAVLDNEDTGPVPVIRVAKPAIYGSRTLTTVLAPVTAVAVVLLAVSLAGAAVLRDEPEAEFQPSNQSTSKVDRDRPQETVPGQTLKKKKKKKKPSESPSPSESESPSESPSGSPTDPSDLPSPSDGNSPEPSSGSPSPTRPTTTSPPTPTNTGSTGSPTPTNTGTPTSTPTTTPPTP